MNPEIVEVKADLTGLPLYSPDLAPVPGDKRTWNVWSLAALWVGMAVCIPTYLLASYMISTGVHWLAALIIIGLANVIITVPMVLNGHAGVKYGVPFPVLGRAAFGHNGIHVAAVVRAIVACGWFGIQTWIGGLSLYAIWNAMTGSAGAVGLDAGKFVGFGVFWLINLYFVWKGTESIKWLENLSAPILIILGIGLIVWGAQQAGGFGIVLEQGQQLQKQAITLAINNGQPELQLNPLRTKDGQFKATEYQLTLPMADGTSQEMGWQSLTENALTITNLHEMGVDDAGLSNGSKVAEAQFRVASGSDFAYSSKAKALQAGGFTSFADRMWNYILWLTAMVGFWATMSLSIADITRYAARQKDQIAGQFIGLPGTMILYSFIGIFVTCAAVINFKDILIANDAPWDPVTLLSRFDNPLVVIFSQIFMIIATLTTNIAANVIAPANAFANLMPQKISFKRGGLITGIIGIIICPWWLLNEIAGILIFVSGLLGPVLGILLCDYFVIRKQKLNVPDLYKTDGEYAYKSGFNPAAMIALAGGVLLALVGYWLPTLAFLYKLSWFSGFAVSFGLYWMLYRTMNNEQ